METLVSGLNLVRLMPGRGAFCQLQVTRNSKQNTGLVICSVFFLLAGVAELADALDLGSCARKGVGVRLPPSANLLSRTCGELPQVLCLRRFRPFRIVSRLEDPERTLPNRAVCFGRIGWLETNTEAAVMPDALKWMENGRVRRRD